MKKNNILHLTGMTSDKLGGLESYLLELTSFCKKNGFNSILQYNSLPKSKVFLNKLKEIGTHVVVLDIRHGLYKPTMRTVNLIRKFKPKIVHTHFYPPFWVPIISRICKVEKTITTVHSLYRLNKMSRKRFSYSCYNNVFCVSDAIAADLIKAGVRSDIISTHYLGLAGQRVKSQVLRLKFREEFNIPREAVVLSTIGFDSHVKGIDILLAAIKIIIHKHHNVHVLIVGVDPKFSRLPLLADADGISARVHWAGVRDEGWQLLNAADIYVQPSRSEGLPFSIMEAMALRLPVVATRVGGVSEIVSDGKTGFLTKPESAESLAVTIEKLLAAPQEQKLLGEQGYLRYQSQFKAENSVRKLVENYCLFSKK